MIGDVDGRTLIVTRIWGASQASEPDTLTPQHGGARWWNVQNVNFHRGGPSLLTARRLPPRAPQPLHTHPYKRSLMAKSAQRVEDALAKFKKTLDDLKAAERSSVAARPGHSAL